MEKLKPTCFCIVILPFLLSHVVDAQTTTLLRSLNLSPFMKWRSAYHCMSNDSNELIMKYSPSCEKEQTITIEGVVNVNQSEVAKFCRAGGCAEYMYDILNCIFYSKQDFWFENKITVTLLNNTIAGGCANQTAFSTANYTSSAIKTYKNLLLSSAAAAAMVTLTLFNL